MNAWEIQSDGGIDALVPVVCTAVKGAHGHRAGARGVLNYRDLLRAGRGRWTAGAGAPCRTAPAKSSQSATQTRFKVGDHVAAFLPALGGRDINAAVMESAWGACRHAAEHVRRTRTARCTYRRGGARRRPRRCPVPR